MSAIYKYPFLRCRRHVRERSGGHINKSDSAWPTQTPIIETAADKTQFHSENTMDSLENP
jgi:hypothetical protein